MSGWFERITWKVAHWNSEYIIFAIFAAVLLVWGHRW